MTKIIHKLNLNKTPQLVESNSIVFAKNIKLLKDGTIGADTAIEQIIDLLIDVSAYSIELYGICAGVDNKLYLFANAKPEPHIDNYVIYQYNEQNKSLKEIQSAWSYGGGIIEGYTTINHTGETILTINEYFENTDSRTVPLKHINLAHCSKNDDESIYTQAPNVPITNLLLQTTYQQIIPNGVYQFFIRYKIRENFYTNWFPCSSELFAGTRKITNTIQGQLIHVDTKVDAGKSFVFQVEHIFDKSHNDIDYTKSFENYQIGFILSHDDSTVARSWKSFNFDVNTIYFDYDKNSMQEEDIDELLKVTYNLYNVKNVTYFKNKLYITNYKETDFNPQLQQYAKNIKVSLVQKEITEPGIYINNNKLSHSADTTASSYYDKIGNSSSIDLFNSNICDNSEINNTISQYSSKDGDKGAYTAYLTWNADIDPDVCWVNKATSELNNNSLGFQGFNDKIEFDLGTDTEDTGWKKYLINTDYVYYNDRETTDSNTHPWNKILDLAHCWFIASGEGDSYYFDIDTKKIDIYDNGFTNNWEAINKVKAKLDNIVNSINNFSNICIGVYITSANNNYYITGSKKDVDNITNAYNIPNNGMYQNIDDLIQNAKNDIKSHIVGIDENGVFGINVNGTVIPIDSYTIVYSTLNATSVLTHNYTAGKSIDSNIRVTLSRTNHIITYNCKIYNKYITKQNKVEQYRTLMPFTDYEFYIHFVETNGVATNGYLIDSKQLSVYDVTKPNSIIYPIFNNIRIPNTYASCFISINKVTNDIAQIFNHSHDSTYHYADCIELDTLLYNFSDNITIIDSSGNTITTKAKYYTSSDSVPTTMLGNCGTIRWDNDGTDIDNVYNSIQLKDIVINSSDNPMIDTIQFKINNVTDITQFIPIDNTKKINTNRILSTYKNLQITTEYDFGNNTSTIELINYQNIINTYKELDIIIKNDIYQLNKDHISSINNIAENINTCFGKYFYASTYEILKDNNNYNITYKLQNIDENTDIQFIGITNNDEQVILDNKTITRTKWNTVTIKAYTTPGAIKCIKVLYSKNNSIDEDKNIIEEKTAELIPTKNWWIKINTKQQNSSNKRLIKITPYLILNNYSLTTYDNPDYLNLPGYKCDIKKLTRAFANTYYVSGTDVYTKNTTSDNTVKLTITNDYQSLASSTTFTILSNFNLSYLTNTEDINSQIRTFTDAAGTKSKQILTAVESLTNSFILELPSMYKEYTRKYYSVYNTNTITKFNNTIRSSNSNVDEAYRNIYTFDAIDYYNCPTNRGNIISLFSINNCIYVHTEHSLYKFSGSNSLNSEEGTVSLKEGDAFDTGITEIFDSQYGYAGLQKKSQSLITFNNYVFYDALSKNIYAFGGNSNLITISDPIQKLLEWLSPIDIVFAEDLYNDRFFINIFSKKGNVCLSFNAKTNNFVAIHDFTFTKAISTRTNTYFVNNISNGFIYAFNYNDINKYSQLYCKSAITIADESDTEIENYIDIIYTDYYETIKVLNYVSWISNKINNYHQTNNNYCAEENISPYAGTKIRIYSDQCSTKLINLVDNDNNPLIQNEQTLADPNNYLYPRYNCGIWNINYFRDIKNITDIYKYNNTTNDQDKSLMYGKYFVVRLIYKDVNFKLENITFNIQDYEQA